MEGKKKFIEGVKKGLEKLSLNEAEMDKGLKRTEFKEGFMDMEMFGAEKIEKAIFSITVMYEPSMTENSVIVWPADDYDLPFYWCSLTQMPGMNILIIDFMPLMDVVLCPQYGEKYLLDLQVIKNSATEKLKDGILDKAFSLSTKTKWAFSPQSTVFLLTDEIIHDLGPVVDEYSKLYIKLWQEAKTFDQDEERQFCKRKKEATRKLLRENDPGYYPLLNILGEDKTNRLFDLFF